MISLRHKGSFWQTISGKFEFDVTYRRSDSDIEFDEIDNVAVKVGKKWLGLDEFKNNEGVTLVDILFDMHNEEIIELLEAAEEQEHADHLRGKAEWERTA